jgi:hypothetical protein
LDAGSGSSAEARADGGDLRECLVFNFEFLVESQQGAKAAKVLKHGETKG